MAKFNKVNVREYRNDLARALVVIEAKYGVRIDIGTLRFSGDEVRGKITATKVVQSETVGYSPALPQAQVEWNALAPKHGFSPAEYGRRIVVAGRVLKISGIDRRGSRTVIKVTGSRGGKYVIDVPLAKKALGKS